MKCIFCFKETTGIVINYLFICSECERKLLRFEPGTDFYEFYRKKIAKVLYLSY